MFGPSLGLKITHQRAPWIYGQITCYVKTNDGYLVVDTGPSYQFAKQAYAEMKKIADLPVKYVIDSHGHADHWLGITFL